MLKIFGKNNNSLFRKSKKTTYSMPQSLTLPESLLKCALGFDFIALVTVTNKLYFLYQAKFYHIQNVPALIDVATSQNTITMVTKDNQILVWDFDEEKVIHNSINFSKIKVNSQMQKIVQVKMGENDIFLLSQSGKVYYFKRNQWYETKTFSNIQLIELSHRIIDVSSGPQMNLFLSYEGIIFQSSKEKPLSIRPINTKERFMKISTNLYNAAITKKGTIMIWGQSIHGKFESPTQFSKLTKKFIEVQLDAENGYALSDDGEVWAWGVNQFGELGLSDYEPRVKPFPLITLDKFRVLQIFCGLSYACCLCDSQQKIKDQSIQIVNRKVTEFEVSKQKSQKKNQRSQSKGNYLQKSDYNIEGDSWQFSKEQNQFDHKKTDDRRKRSVSPQNSRNFSQKAQKLQHILKQNKGQTHKWLKYDDFANDQSIISEKRNLELEVVELRQQNTRLKSKVTEQSDTIKDITAKIRLLQEAIEEYERNLTSRDHILTQYQSKQHQYIVHIEELQKTIDQIVRLKQKNNEIMVVYEDMKVNFEKERSYYTDKIKDYELRMHFQQERFKQQIQKVKRKSQYEWNKQNTKNKWESHSPISRKNDSPCFRTQILGERQMINTVDEVIDQIQSNKNIIAKSANKLISMLDISQ